MTNLLPEDAYWPACEREGCSRGSDLHQVTTAIVTDLDSGVTTKAPDFAGGRYLCWVCSLIEYPEMWAADARTEPFPEAIAKCLRLRDDPTSMTYRSWHPEAFAST